MISSISDRGYLPISRQEALASGVTEWQWRELIRHKQLHPLAYGVYAVAVPDDDRLRMCQRTCAATLRKTDHFALAASALAIHDLPNPHFRRWSRIPVTLGGPRSQPHRGIRRSTDVPIPSVWGPVTDLADTARQIAADLPLPQALMVTDAVARRLAGTTDRFALASERVRVEVRRQLTEMVSLPALSMADPAAESPAESFYRGHMLLAGLPEPRCGVPVLGYSGKWFFADLMLDSLIIEIDGFRKYKEGGPRVLIDEKQREDDLRAAGHDFHRPFVEDIYADPQAAMRELLDKIGGHRRSA